MSLRVVLLLPQPARQQGLKVRLALDVASQREVAELVDIAPLALAGRVVISETRRRLGSAINGSNSSSMFGSAISSRRCSRCSAFSAPAARARRSTSIDRFR